MRLLRLKILLFLFIFCVNRFSAQTKFKKEFYLISVPDSISVLPFDKNLMDSLLNIYHKTTNDTTKLVTLRNLSDALSDERLWVQYNKIVLNKTQFKNDTLSITFYGSALNNIGYEYQYLKNDIPNALKYYELSFAAYNKIGNYEGMGTAKNNMAYIFQHQGNISKSVEYYTDAYNLFLRKNYNTGLVSILINLGDIYFNNNDFDKAEDCFNKAMYYCRKTKNNYLLGNVYHQLAAIHKYHRDFSQADYFLKQAIDIYEKEFNYNRLAIMYMTLADNYSILGNKALATITYSKAISTLKDASDLSVRSRVYGYAAGFYYGLKETRLTKTYADSAYFYAKQLGYPDLIHNAALKLSDYHHWNGDPTLAYDFLREATRMSDSLNSDKIKKSILEQQFKSDFEKKEIQLALQQEKKDAIVRSKQQKQKLILILVVIALIAISIVLFIVYRSYVSKKRSASILEEKNKIIFQQKRLVEEKQKEVLESFRYAGRIQRSLLPTEKYIDRVLDKLKK